ncbi:ATP-binding cassette domain-containing protein [Pediococcus ethanolidurans]|uniref:ABC-type oligopeptide transport system, ATPase component n=1 Tax=Pediococcus ethanolidurans TaxID=319653 RepID=A0A0R2KB60_9LACO|nr:ATP-binding cassette domain-containing protein [Pediococcus ethanolidurans]KRN83501.1 ABC-type oligopeptide transport system, ATPase component [Pediococcus ethanolidurans]MCV3314854.1 ATP-binding cassette domain-containing protein [Pediococcus ethanolidurans]MDV7719616.1 ATP-binding cassette domain-containing protein [Pediococcus ethanolidurans]SER26111.1 peptide/nickel transport system ATP-binding protein [Pediococcus ethanolidurans]GEN94396.1 ABC transporter ATP-binding protein [Pediococc
MSLVEVKDLKVHYPIRSGFFNRIHDYVYAVDGVNFEIEPGQTYGLIGETGSGKTTIGRSIIGLEKITSGKILFDGHDVSTKKERNALHYNRDVQMIFQDSLSSLNPKKRIYDIIAEPLRNFEKLSDTEEKHRVRELLDTVGLGDDDLFKYPFEFSGGQRQRIGVARAISTNPKLVIADEPVSALDLSVQAQVLNYMQEIQKQFNISYLFISHDLGVVRHMCDSMAIMHRGRFVELGTRDDIYNHPQHIYTKRLLAAIPDVNVDERDAHRKHRKEVEKVFDTEQSRYYDKNGRVLPLQKVSETHSVALPEDQVKGE